MKKIFPKIIVILGPTASGKSNLAVRLAKKFNGEIISADSRQVYKGLNIGTGKITKREMQNIPHYLLDIVSPKRKNPVTVQEFKTKAEKIIQDILKRNKLPIICGGTGFYIQAVVDNITFPEVAPNKKLRTNLSKKTSQELFEILKKLDKTRAKNIDKHNPVRLIRAIEIAKALGKVPVITLNSSNSNSQSFYSVLYIGITTEDKILKEKIYKRILARLTQKNNMILEAKKLHASGLSFKRMNELGLEYRYLALYLQNKISKQEFIEKLNSEIWKYAKRQKTWFKRDKKIKWFTITEQKKIKQEVKKFLK